MCSGCLWPFPLGSDSQYGIDGNASKHFRALGKFQLSALHQPLLR